MSQIHKTDQCDKRLILPFKPRFHHQQLLLLATQQTDSLPKSLTCKDIWPADLKIHQQPYSGVVGTPLVTLRNKSIDQFIPAQPNADRFSTFFTPQKTTENFCEMSVNGPRLFADFLSPAENVIVN
ncbi:MAG: hypothetical protein MI754_14625 [Chromatiales bacterium]|nr:hypothetical protein [Chromatiales bacterium]